MLACIPTNGSTGLDDTVSDHFGSAHFFTLYDDATGELKVLENRNAHHSHGTCHPMAQLAKYKIDCVVCSGMGRRAIEALNSEGIKIYHCESTRVRDIVVQIKTGDLEEIDPATACHGHGQRGGCAHHGGRTSIVEIEQQRRRGGGFGQGGGRGQGGRN
ncbi:MAG: NifB/NifX family molybdenum-iron cluster-binding protein [Candidatus Zixiibacteriota bacterium]